MKNYFKICNYILRNIYIMIEIFFLFEWLKEIDYSLGKFFYGILWKRPNLIILILNQFSIAFIQKVNAALYLIMNDLNVIRASNHTMHNCIYKLVTKWTHVPTNVLKYTIYGNCFSLMYIDQAHVISKRFIENKYECSL